VIASRSGLRVLQHACAVAEAGAFTAPFSVPRSLSHQAPEPRLHVSAMISSGFAVAQSTQQRSRSFIDEIFSRRSGCRGPPARLHALASVTKVGRQVAAVELHSLTLQLRLLVPHLHLIASCPPSSSPRDDRPDLRVGVAKSSNRASCRRLQASTACSARRMTTP